jgi:formylglycine-generating enzyme required for sulfatase activity
VRLRPNSSLAGIAQLFDRFGDKTVVHRKSPRWLRYALVIAALAGFQYACISAQTAPQAAGAAPAIPIDANLAATISDAVPLEIAWTATDSEGTLTLPGGVIMKFAWIPPGKFLMGTPVSEGGRDSDEKPQHEVTISNGFWMGVTEVTQPQWESVMPSNPSQFRGELLPVDSVTWNECQQFVARLNVGRGAVFQLPTESQWEYACRAGSTTPFFFGYDAAQLINFAWYFNNSSSATHPVGLKKPNPWGLFDIYGNQEEWCQDVYQSNYKGAPSNESAFEISIVPATSATSPKRPHRSLRGGSRQDTLNLCRSASRRGWSPNNFAASYFGFRLVRNQDQPGPPPAPNAVAPAPSEQVPAPQASAKPNL